MKVLIVAPSWIGDTLIAQPLLSRIKQQSPESRIEVLASDHLAPLLRRMPEVDEVICNPFAHGEFNLGARRRLGHRITSTNFQRAYVLPNTWKSALVPYFAGIPERIGYHGEVRYFLLTERHRVDVAAHPKLVQRYAALAGPLDGELASPHLTSSVAQQQKARRDLQLPNDGLPQDARPVIFCPGAEFGPAKRWPARHFAELAKRLSKHHPVWIIGTPKDTPLGDEIVTLSSGAALNLCGRTSLEQAIDLIASSHSVVCNDSGLMHVAAALGRPLVALYGSSSPEYTPPLSAKARIVSRNLPCSPCFKRECPLQHLDCLNGLSPATVEQIYLHEIANDAH